MKKEVTNSKNTVPVRNDIVVRKITAYGLMSLSENICDCPVCRMPEHFISLWWAPLNNRTSKDRIELLQET